MKILYGVQGTGQGHISRARAMRNALADRGVEVTWLFSGRNRERFFDMEPFGDFEHRRGLTFFSEAGKIDHFATLRRNNLLTFCRDVRALDLAPFDLVVTDYEPVSAWAARLGGTPCIGIGHQYAFTGGTPMTGENLLTRALLRYFAPVSIPLGLHWHPYAANVLPPILDLPPLPRRDEGFVLVYLPFEDQRAVTELLRECRDFRFVQYANGLSPGVQDNVTLKAASTAGFKGDLATCSGVICNSGFELISECLQWGKPVLTKPLAGQLEQLSNALALERLQFASILQRLSAGAVRDWLAGPLRFPPRNYPDVAAALAGWIAGGCRDSAAELSASLWSRSRPVARPQPALARPAAVALAG